MFSARNPQRRRGSERDLHLRQAMASLADAPQIGELPVGLLGRLRQQTLLST
jgi:hypothetical protein